jgi:hypothetical protein
MKTEIFCTSDRCMMNSVVYDSDNPATLAEHVVCDECLQTTRMDRTRMNLAWLILGQIEDRDVEQIARLLDHLFGVKKDPKLTAAGIYSLTERQRKKLKRQMFDEFGPQLPDVK